MWRNPLPPKVHLIKNDHVPKAIAVLLFNVTHGFRFSRQILHAGGTGFRPSVTPEEVRCSIDPWTASARWSSLVGLRQKGLTRNHLRVELPRHTARQFAGHNRRPKSLLISAGRKKRCCFYCAYYLSTLLPARLSFNDHNPVVDQGLICVFLAP